MFSLIDDLLLRTVDVTDPETLVSLHRILPRGGTAQDFSVPMFEEIRDHNHVLSGTVGFSWSRIGISINGAPAEMVTAGFYSGNYFSVLGVRPLLGRTFSPADDKAGANAVALMSYSYWTRQLSADPSVVGKTISAKGFLVTIIGVTPPGYTGLYPSREPPDFELPLVWLPQFLLNDDTPDVHISGRLNAEATLQQARAELNVIFSRVLRNSLDPQLSKERQQELLGQSIEVAQAGTGDRTRWEDYKLRLTVLMGVTSLLLLICCANVANLLLARAATRQKEIAIRLSIGAGRATLIRQLLTESILLSSFGGGAGILSAIWTRAAMRNLLGLSDTADTLNWHVFVFAAAISFITAVVFGMAPALRSTRVDLTSSLKEGATRLVNADGSSHFSFGKALVVSQVALSLLLTISAGLLVRTLVKLNRIDPGFDSHNVLLFWAYPTTLGYEGAKEIHLYEELLRRFNRMPGVVRASMVRHQLMQGGYNWSPVSIPGNSESAGDQAITAVNVAAPGYFETMRIPLLAGRDFLANDGAGAPRVAVVDRKFAVNHFGQENPLGKLITLGDVPGQSIQIVGVIRENRYYSLRQDSSVPSEQVYLPFTQAPRDMLGQMCFTLRTTAKPMSVLPAVRRLMQTVDTNLPAVSAGTQDDEVQDSIRQERSLALLLGVFGSLAVLLACFGLYGVMSYMVARRTGEIGIRMALGAQRSDVVGLVMRGSMVIAVFGIGIGVMAALATSRYLNSLLYGIAASDLSTFLISAVLLAAVAMLAAYLPARRATRVDPMTALRRE